jgi:hypothetical protein
MQGPWWRPTVSDGGRATRAFARLVSSDRHAYRGHVLGLGGGDAVAAGAEITAGNASGLLSPGQRDQVARLIATMGGPGSVARTIIEAM